MKLPEASASIAYGPRWSLVLLYDDGEFGVVDAQTDIAEHLMRNAHEYVVGIYRPDQYRYLDGDVASFLGAAKAA